MPDSSMRTLTQVAVSTLHSATPKHTGAGVRPIFLIISLTMFNAMAVRPPISIERWKDRGAEGRD
jgi:hypothetical protein